MTRTERLDPVVQLTDKKEQQALQDFAYSQSQVAAEKARLQQLKEYRAEYLDKQDQTDISWPAIELQEFNRFLSQLDDTINAQLEVIKLREKELAMKRESWNQTRVSKKAMHKVVENWQQEEQLQASRIEQKVMDEFSQRKVGERDDQD